MWDEYNCSSNGLRKWKDFNKRRTMGKYMKIIRRYNLEN